VLLDEADRCAKNALECRPNNPYAFNSLGRIWFLQGDSQEADRYFSLAIEHASEGERDVKSEGLGGLGRSLRAMSDLDRARRIEELLRIDPSRYGQLLGLLPAELRRNLAARLVAEDPQFFGPLLT
jgi:tetratricopeptide (TPR) repeat protein